MARIPYGGSGTVADNLVDTSPRSSRASDGRGFIAARRPAATTAAGDPRRAARPRRVLGPGLGIAAEDLSFFGERIWQILTSCAERRHEEYEKTGWWDFIGAPSGRSERTRSSSAIGCTRSLVAAQAELASTKTIGDIFAPVLFDIAEPDVSTDRVLNGPTNDVWIDPWLAYLRGRGVDYRLRPRVRAIEIDGGVVRGVTVEQDRRLTRGARPTTRRGAAGRGHGRGCSPTSWCGRSAAGRHLPAQPQHRLDERHPVLPDRGRADRPRPHDLPRLALGADVDLAAPVLVATSTWPLRRRATSAACSPSTSPTGTRPALNGKPARDCTRRGDQGRGLGAAQAQPERRRSRRAATTTASSTGTSISHRRPD